MKFLIVVVTALLLSVLVIFSFWRWTVSVSAFWAGAVLLVAIWLVGVPYFLESA